MDNTLFEQAEEQKVENTIVISDLEKSYGSKKVLDKLNITIRRGELFGLIGKNGIGKSTTIDCLIGAKKFNSGDITLEGISIKKDPEACKKMIGYVSSEPALYPEMTGIDYLDFIAGIYGVPEDAFEKNLHYLSTRLDLPDEDLHRYAGEYSHGMMQKLCLIGSLIHNPDIWILDEPTVGLDILAVEELKQMMFEYAHHGKTVVLTSHNIDLVAKFCDRVAILNKGKAAAVYDLVKQPNRRVQLPKLFVEIYR